MPLCASCPSTSLRQLNTKSYRNDRKYTQSAEHSCIVFLFLFILYLSMEAGVEASLLLLRSSIGVLYQPWMIDDNSGANSGMNEWQGKPKYPHKNLP
jgi:hypothetical protein